MSVDTLALVENKREYVDHLLDLLTEPLLVQFSALYDALVTARKPRILEAFQEELKELSRWNVDRVREWHDAVLRRTRCTYLPDLLKAICVVCTQLHMASARSANRLPEKIKVRVPAPDVFVHHCAVEFGRHVWKRPYLFYHQVRSLERQKNIVQCERIMRRAIAVALRNALPMDDIVAQLVAAEDAPPPLPRHAAPAAPDARGHATLHHSATIEEEYEEDDDDDEGYEDEDEQGEPEDEQGEPEDEQGEPEDEQGEPEDAQGEPEGALAAEQEGLLDEGSDEGALDAEVYENEAGQSEAGQSEEVAEEEEDDVAGEQVEVYKRTLEEEDEGELDDRFEEQVIEVAPQVEVARSELRSEPSASSLIRRIDLSDMARRPLGRPNPKRRAPHLTDNAFF